MKRSRKRILWVLALAGLGTSGWFLTPVLIDQWHIHKLSSDDWESSANALLERSCSRGVEPISEVVLAKDHKSFPSWLMRFHALFGSESKLCIPALQRAAVGASEEKRKFIAVSAKVFGRLPELVPLYEELYRDHGLNELSGDAFVALGPMTLAALPTVRRWLTRKDNIPSTALGGTAVPPGMPNWGQPPAFESPRRFALRALAQMATVSDEATELLIDSSKSSDPELALEAVHGLGLVAGDSKVQRVLVRQLRTESPLRIPALSALARLAECQAAREILAPAIIAKEAWTAQINARGFHLALDWNAPSDRDSAVLKAALTSNARQLRESAREAIVSIAPLLSPGVRKELVPILVEQLGENLRAKGDSIDEMFLVRKVEQPGMQFISPVALALSRLAPESVPALIAELENAQRKRRLGSALALGLAGEEASDAVPALREALRRVPDSGGTNATFFASASAPIVVETSQYKTFLAFALLQACPKERDELRQEAAQILWEHALPAYLDPFPGIGSELLLMDIVARDFPPNSIKKAELSEGMTNPTSIARLFTLRLIPRVLPSDAASKILFRHFRGEATRDPEAITRAVADLGEVDDQSAELLRGFLRTPDLFSHALASCRTLGKQASALGPDLLRESLRTRQVTEHLEDDASLQQIVSRFPMPDPAQEVAQDALNEIHEKSVTWRRRDHERICEALLSIHTDSSDNRNELLERLEKGNQALNTLIILAALEPLTIEGDLEARLVRLLQHGDALVRVRAARILRKAGTRSDLVVPALLRSLADVSYAGLSRPPDSMAIHDELSQSPASLDTFNPVRAEALRELAALGPSAAKDLARWIDLVRKQVRLPSLRALALHTLSRLGETIAASEIAGAIRLEHESPSYVSQLYGTDQAIGAHYRQRLGYLVDLGEHLLPLLPRLENMAGANGVLGDFAAEILDEWRKRNPELAR